MRAQEMSVGDLPILWHFPVSHFNEKARWALDYKRMPHVRRALFLDYPVRAWWRTRQLHLPILLLGDRAIHDSTRIIAELERAQPDPALYPKDEGERRRALALEDFFDEELGPPLRTLVVGALWDFDPRAALSALATGQSAAAQRWGRRLVPILRTFYRTRHRINPETQAAARPQVMAALERLRAELGGGDYLVGDTFSVADLTAAALLAPFVGPPEFPYPPQASSIPEPAQEMFAELSSLPAADWMREMYRRHRGTSMEVGA